jgi:hypothetical protein
MPADSAFAQALDLTLTPVGAAAKERPLPVGATPNVTISVRNNGKAAVGPLTLSARVDGASLAGKQDWRLDAGAAVLEVARLSAGERIERRLRLSIERAPFEGGKATIEVEARAKAGVLAKATTALRVADCAGAYRTRLAVLRSGLIDKMRQSADVLSRPDPALPAGRIFPAPGSRGNPLAAAEQLATALAERRGSDPQMATEWFRFLIHRFASELNLYAAQPPAPGLCANNYYQIAGYRQGLQPITKRIDAVQEAAATSMAAARAAAKAEPDEDLAAIVRRVVQLAGWTVPESAEPPTAVLAEARGVNGRDLNLLPDVLRALSLTETAAWLADADARGQALKRAIEEILQTISTAHKETCVCAY